AAYLGAGTVYLLSRTGFGYFAAFSVFVGGLFAPLSQLRLVQQGHPTAWTNVWLVVAGSALAAVAIGYATARHRQQAAHVLTALLSGRLNSRVPATMLIALGGFVPSITSGLERYGVTWSFYLGQLLGVLLILAGFLVSEEVFSRSGISVRSSVDVST